MTKLRILRWGEFTLDYADGPDVITGPLHAEKGNRRVKVKVIPYEKGLTGHCYL